MNDAAIFLDLDNVAIGSAEAYIRFDVNLIIDHVREMTQGRVVLRRAYADWRQKEKLIKALAAAGFELQSTVRLGMADKNLADMQITVDAMETLVDGHQLSTYVLVTGDRDFMPLVHCLRKRGKQVIGIGLKPSSSRNLVTLCDHYVYYEDLKRPEHDLPRPQKEGGVDLEKLLIAALDDLGEAPGSRIVASLVKQRMQLLSDNAFGQTPSGKGSFREFLSRYPHLVTVELDETTLYAIPVAAPAGPDERPSPKPGNGAKVAAAAGDSRRLSNAEINKLLQQALDETLQDEKRVMASVFKTRLRELSDGAFDESQQGDKSFRKFLERHARLVGLESEGTNLYVTRSVVPEKNLSPEELLARGLAAVLKGQSEARASLLKQVMSELSDGRFSETELGYDSFRAFLEAHPDRVVLQQHDSTLFVARPGKSDAAPDAPHLLYRRELKKQGLRVIPAEMRLALLNELTTLLSGRSDNIRWQELLDELKGRYERTQPDPISKSMVNDLLRLAQRANLIDAPVVGALAISPVYWRLNSERPFQEAVMLSDMTYLRGLMEAGFTLDLDEAALALYDDPGRSRYLKVIAKRLGQT
jgi:uncharacterized protein (TIGR00288 family)